MNSPIETTADLRGEELTELALDYTRKIKTDPELLAEALAEYLDRFGTKLWSEALYAVSTGDSATPMHSILQVIAQWYGYYLAEEHLAETDWFLEMEE